MKTAFKKLLNLHTTLLIIITLTGCLGLGLVLLADSTHRNLAVKLQENALEDLLSIKSKDLINELIQNQKELGFVMQSEDGFMKAFTERNQKELKYWLDQEFNRYYATTALIKLEKLVVYDTDFRPVSRSARGIAMSDRGTPPCVTLIRSMSQLPAAEHVKPRSELCLYDNKPLLSTIVSIGSLLPRGYIQIVSDPAFNLASIEDKLGIELKISTYDAIVLHQSSHWPESATTNKNLLFSEHNILSSDGNPLLVVSGASYTRGFYNSLEYTTYKIIASSVFVILTALAVALAFLNHALHPLKHLHSAALEVSKGNLVTVNEEGFSEISGPIQLFNKAVARINALANDLESEITAHNTTEEQLNLAIKQAEENALSAGNQRNFLKMTLQSVIDGVITTDTSAHVTYINPIAEKLTGWSDEDANGKPLVQIVHACHETTRDRIYELINNSGNNSVLKEPVSAILIQNGSNVETPVEYVATPMLDHEDNIAGNVIIIHDKSAQRSLNRQLTFQATHDALTGLLNRFEFERKLRQVIAENDGNTSHVLCYLDIDEFTSINDKYGHTAGDELLKQVTAILETNIFEKHTLARLGSDEYGLLLENCTIPHAENIIYELLRIIDRFNFTWDMSTIGIGMSIGLVEITSSEIPYNEILNNANSACCLAMEDGRNRLQIYTPENNRLLTQQREMHWVSRINLALEEERFQLYYHEILPLQNDTSRFLRHGEVLLRMIDKKGEIVSPDMFLPAAERYGMLGVIDEWVVEKTLAWLGNTGNNAIISLNISGASLDSKDFLNFVVSRIKQSSINPELLCFEVTEAAAIRHLSAATHFMTVLKKLGCSFALDDFGSGLSSFSYLTSLPVDYLKINGTFVVDIDKDPMHYAMVKSINEVGHVMGIKTIAEFAASSRIIDCLREIGVDNAQGYAIARPVPLASLDGNDDGISHLTVV